MAALTLGRAHTEQERNRLPGLAAQAHTSLYRRTGPVAVSRYPKPAWTAAVVLIAARALPFTRA